ncbi:NitT/TauT family transport system substrate-binding protein [Paenibacillus sp. V4I3]|uniref:ABC transporter substrate-binding protein n=1 Tax=unclassified Paenibacillus TaxID=185978 RepID=UPI00277FEE5D|nr:MULTISPECIES: ABC transporter substrate-binding protein [unclassified Paenibacillus]MDQ0873927.1 NitT/TauT family transport system substrate-binding protein [Paenibacillus sp. V4I3]MDQ0890196.1 NitT/TauT family transport system substrate-binding protein [Paenibacillus sp. V4I9]
MKKLGWVMGLVLTGSLLLSACGQSKEAPSSAASTTVKIGILKNVTHAPGFVALQNNYFQQGFGQNAKIEVTAFDNGADFATAIATDQIDLGYVGPGPVINQYLKSKNIKVISGANNGGAVLVARKDAGIQSVKDLVGKTVAVAAKGGTPDLSLRLLLKQEGLKVSTDTSGVQIVTRAPADTLVAIRQKEVDATLIAEPWGTQIIQEGSGTILVDWNKIPPKDGNYPLTILVASDKFLKEHRDLAKKAVKANKQAIEFIQQNPSKAYGLISEELKQLTGKGMDPALIKAAIDHLKLTEDITLDDINEQAKASFEAGYLKVKAEELDFTKFLDLTLLNEVKKEK